MKRDACIKSALRILVLVGLSIALETLNAPNVEAQYGGYGGEFLRYGIGGRPMGMGGAYVGVSEGGAAIFFNPAGLSQIDRLQLSYMSSTLFLGTKYKYLAAVYPLYDLVSRGDKIVLGLGRVSVGTEGIEERDASQELVGTYSDEQTAWILPVAYDYVGEAGRLGLSLELNYVSHSIAGYNAGALGYGLSALYQPTNPPLVRRLGGLRLPLLGSPFSLENLMKWRIGVLYRALPKLTMYRESEDLPDIIRAGVSFVTPLFADRVWVVSSFESGWSTGAPRRLSGGFEIGSTLWRGATVSVRVGKRFGSFGCNRGLTFGFGVESGGFWPKSLPMHGEVALDYVHDTHSILGGSDGLFFTLRLLQRHEDVSSLQLTGGKKCPASVLRRALTWHARDKRRFGFDSLAVRIDSKYRDGSESGDSTGIAELLLQLAENRGDAVAASRYDDFIGGFKRLVASTVRCIATWKKSLGSSSICFQKLGDDWRRREKKLVKAHNAQALAVYLDYEIASGDVDHGTYVVTGIAKQNRAFHDAQQIYYEALLSRNPSLMRRAAKGAESPAVRVYLRFLAAALEGNADSLRAIANLREAKLYSFEEFPAAPLLADGTVADDAELLSLLFSLSSSPEELKAGFLKLLVRFPMTDAALLILAHRAALSTTSGIRQLASDLKNYYASRLIPGDVISGW